MTNEQIFGEWFVMTKENIIQWDALVEELNAKRIETQAPVWGFTTATTKEAQ